MPSKPHSNLLENANVHHLYAIYDFEKREIFKFGISDNPVTEQYTSARLESQLALYNRVAGWRRFTGRILIYPIDGRLSARQMEDQAILTFQQKRGRYPRGNPDHRFLRSDLT